MTKQALSTTRLRGEAEGVDWKIYVTGTRPDQGEQQPRYHSAARAARWKRQNGTRSVVYMYSNVLVVVSVVLVVVVVARGRACMLT